jgi:hypothetical protein
MRADICDASDEKAVERFRSALRRLGAQIDDKSWVAGCDIYRLKIGDETLTVFSDELSLDIEGSQSLIQKVLEESQVN